VAAINALVRHVAACCEAAPHTLQAINLTADERILIPVYLPAGGAVGILPVPPSLRPKGLLPQLYGVLKAPKPMVAFITRRGDQYIVATKELPEGADDGAEAIKSFKTAYEAGAVTLAEALGGG
jgi:hypothetical protein